MASDYWFEVSLSERLMRAVARAAGVPFKDWLNGDGDEEIQRVVRQALRDATKKGKAKR